jgi:tRNA(Arg) A34 adenosine deaminase TadA
MKKRQRQSIVAILRDKKGCVIAMGHNSYKKTHPLQAKIAKKFGRPEAIYLHAEIMAISLCKQLSQAYSIEVIRIGRCGKLVLAKPCPICLYAIKTMTNIEYISYSTDDNIMITEKTHEVI